MSLSKFRATAKNRRRVVITLVVALFAIPLAAYAGTVFDDVDDDHTHIDGITWVKDSGVSIGCGENIYCPDDFVTRAQMGTFMYRLSGNDPDTDPSVNADEVDGYDANDLVRVAYAISDGATLVGSDGATQIALSTTITAPGPGYLIIDASSDTFSSADDTIACWIDVNGTLYEHSRRTVDFDGDDNESNCATDAVVSLPFGGDYTVDFEFGSLIAGITVDEAVLSVLFVPFDEDGDEPGLVIVLP